MLLLLFIPILLLLSRSVDGERFSVNANLKLSVEVSPAAWWASSTLPSPETSPLYLVICFRNPFDVARAARALELEDSVSLSSIRYVPDDSLRVFGPPSVVMRLVQPFPVAGVFEYDKDAPLDTSVRRSVVAKRAAATQRRAAFTAALQQQLPFDSHNGNSTSGPFNGESEAATGRLRELIAAADRRAPQPDVHSVVGWLLRGGSETVVEAAAAAAAAAAITAGAESATFEPSGGRAPHPRIGSRAAAWRVPSWRVRARLRKDTSVRVWEIEGAVGEAAVASGGLVWVERERVADVTNHVMTSLVQSVVESKRPLWASGLNGSGELLAVGDTGVDWDSCYFRDDDVDGGQSVAYWPNVDWRHRKVVTLKRCEDTMGRLSDQDWEGGHGTHVAGSAIGDVLDSAVVGCRNNCQDYNGLAFAARSYVEDLSCGNSPTALSVPGDFVIYFTPPYELGCRVHVNSWGTELANEYLATDAETDLFTWLHNDYLPIFAAGNTGPGKGVLSPGAAKNVLSVGSHTNTFGGGREDVSRFSSHGPLYDGRVKPEICAPGQQIRSAGADANLKSRQCSLSTKQGTSMATPAVAAAAVLLRQYFKNGYYPTGSPRAGDGLSYISGPLLRAVLIAGSEPLTGGMGGYGAKVGPAPSHYQGFGALTLHRTVPLAPTEGLGIPVGLWFRDAYDDAHGAVAAEGGPITWCFKLQSTSTRPAVDASRPARVRVVLAWVDPPAAEHARSALVNDLDLEVTVVSKSGAQRTQAVNPTIIPSTSDRLNTVEAVMVDTPGVEELTDGATLRVTVRVHMIRQGLGPRQSQAFAVAVNAQGFLNPEVVPCPPTTQCGVYNGQPCGGRGTCVDGVCHCAMEWEGSVCEVCSSRNLCNSRGRCVSDGAACACFDTFGGKHCEACAVGYYGLNCTSRCRCGPGRCDPATGICICPSHRGGEDCSVCAEGLWSKGGDCNEQGTSRIQNGVVHIRTGGRASGYVISNQERLSAKLTNCTWVIEPSAGPPGGEDRSIPGAVVKVVWESFETETPYDPVTVSALRAPRFIYGVQEPCISSQLRFEWEHPTSPPWCQIVSGDRAPSITPPLPGPLSLSYQSDLYSQKPGFVAKWEVVMPPCSSSTCDTTHGTCQGGVCVCKDGYGGADCRTSNVASVVSPCVSPSDRASKALPPVLCSGHGSCHEYEYPACRCIAPWSGAWCERGSSSSVGWVPVEAPPMGFPSPPPVEIQPSPPPLHALPVVPPLNGGPLSPPSVGIPSTPLRLPPTTSVPVSPSDCPTLAPTGSSVWEGVAAIAIQKTVPPWAARLRTHCPTTSCTAAPHGSAVCNCEPLRVGVLCHYEPTLLPQLRGPTSPAPVMLKSEVLTRVLAVMPRDVGAVASLVGAPAGRGVSAVVVGDELGGVPQRASMRGVDSASWVRLRFETPDPRDGVTSVRLYAWPEAWSPLAFLKASAAGREVEVRLTSNKTVCVDVAVGVVGASSGFFANGTNGATVVMAEWTPAAAGVVVSAHTAPPAASHAFDGVNAVQVVDCGAGGSVPSSLQLVNVTPVELLEDDGDSVPNLRDVAIGLAVGAVVGAVLLFIFGKKCFG